MTTEEATDYMQSLVNRIARYSDALQTAVRNGNRNMIIKAARDLEVAGGELHCVALVYPNAPRVAVTA